MAEKEVKGNNTRTFKIETMTRLFAVVGILLLIFVGFNLHMTITTYKSIDREFDRHLNSGDYINQLQNGSDDMTEQSRLFVVTKDPKCMIRYFDIVNNNVREKAHKKLVECFHDKGYETSVNSLNTALKESNLLMDSEIHSMKLMVQSLNIDESIVPDEVKKYALPADEEKWDSGRKQAYASRLVFGKKYRSDKEKIDNDIQAAVDSLSEKLAGDTNQGINTMGHRIERMAMLCVLLAVLLISIFIFVRVYVLKPLQIYVRCVRENRAFDLVGAYEFRYLAQTYNRIFKINKENSSQMNYMLEHDTLTDIYSRLAFEEYKKYLSKSDTPIVLMILDIDRFKSINDTYGHEEGDKALIRVAKTISRFLRNDDFVARIGGDEFAVVMMNAATSELDVVGRKIEQINDILTNPEDGSPRISLSAGIAFSESGYNEDLFEQADNALYDAKAAGRCCYKMYDAD